MKKGNDAVFLLDKPADITSFGCISPIKRLFDPHTGHAGTLDKFASGLLVVMTGRCTKLVPLFMGMDKTYEATIELGRETDTLDPEGQVVATGPVPNYKQVLAAVEKMKGEMLQTPPVYSAVHVNGQRSYKAARAGKDVVLQPKLVNIKEAEVLDYRAPMMRIRLTVSKGTYIRSYARDLGMRLGTCGHVRQLRRTAIGPYSVDNSLDGKDISGYLDRIANPSMHLSVISAIPGMTVLPVTEEEDRRLANGLVPFSLEEKMKALDSKYVTFTRESGGRTFACCVYDLGNKSFVCHMEYNEKA